jgi:hypothetical protein
MASRQKQQQSTKPRTKQSDDSATRSGRPNREDVPSHPNQHKSGYGGEGGSPRTSTDQREIPKKS